MPGAGGPRRLRAGRRDGPAQAARARLFQPAYRPSGGPGPGTRVTRAGLPARPARHRWRPGGPRSAREPRSRAGPGQARAQPGHMAGTGTARTRRVGHWPASGRRRRAYSDSVEPPRRLSIPGCIGCGAMRQYESCAGACRESRLELVSGGDYDELTVTAAACRVGIEGLWAVVGELARTEPVPGEWRAAYETVRLSARSALRRLRPAAGGGDDELLSPAETVIIWRCQDCGGVDAPRECIDVCIWGPADWVDAASYESERSRAVVDREVEQSLAGLLRRFAFATPRDGQWERSWRALQSQAQLVLRSRESRRVADEMAIGQAQPDG